MRLPAFVIFLWITSTTMITIPIVSAGFLNDFLNFTQAAIVAFPSLLTSRDGQLGLRSRTLPSRPGIAPPPSQSLERVKCYGELGCLENTDEWFDLINRPLNWFPLERSSVNTTFFLYSPNGEDKLIKVFPNNTRQLKQHFDPEKPVKFIIHGYVDFDFLAWTLRLSQALLLSEPCNVFIVSWSAGSLPVYTQATANVRLVGLEVANCIRYLSDEFGVKHEDCHCIGHSLGAHACGYAGEKLDGSLGRITGLDPAGPSFQYMPTKVRLDPTDAQFVDVIHTDGSRNLLMGLGMIEPCGHMDFYPNDGKEQPGCQLQQFPRKMFNFTMGYDILEGEILVCSHHRAIHYFTDAVIHRHQYVAHVCQDYQAYLQGLCYPCVSETGDSNCALMGIDADKYSIGNRSLVKFFLSTGPNAPFFLRHYRVNILLAWPDEADDSLRGQLKLSILGVKESLNDIDLNPIVNSTFNRGQNLTYMVQNSKGLGAIKEVILEWKPAGRIYNNLGHMTSCWLSLGCNNHIYIERIVVADMDVINKAPERVRTSVSVKDTEFCSDKGTDYTDIAMGSSAVFRRYC